MFDDINLEKLADIVQGELVLKVKVKIIGVATLKNATASDFSFLNSTKYLLDLEQTKASLLIINKKHQKYCENKNLILVQNVQLAYAKAINYLLSTKQNTKSYIKSSAKIATNATIKNNVTIEDNVVIEDGVSIGENSIIKANSFIGKNTSIGNNAKIYANTTIYQDTIIGNNFVLHSGCVIGSDGFGHVRDGANWLKIPQLGKVRIGNNVDIGASTTIDRGAIDDTIIGNNVIIDNHCQIGHNVELGDGCVMSGMAGIAGSTKIGANSMLGGSVRINGHIQIAPGSVFSGNTMVVKSTKKAGIYSSGMPAMDNLKWRKLVVILAKLDKYSSFFNKLKK